MESSPSVFEPACPLCDMSWAAEEPANIASSCSGFCQRVAGKFETSQMH